MKARHNKDSLAIVKYYDTSTMAGLREQLQDQMRDIGRLGNEVILAFTEPFSELIKRAIQQEKEEYLLNSGDLRYLDKQEDIRNALGGLAKKLHPVNCINTNHELLDKFKKQWGAAIYINLEIGYDIKEHAKNKFMLIPSDTMQYLKLTCRDLLENFKFVEKIPLDESQYIPVKEDLYKAIMRTMVLEKSLNSGYEFRNTNQYKFFSVVNNYPVTIITLVLFLSLLVGITAGCAVECITNEFETGICK